jgi:dihydroxy-acid dehydratase
MGLTTEQIHQPFVGVASCWNEAAPCNIALMRQAQAVKKGVASAGGTPREFCTITVTDGIAMGHEGMRSSLPSREVIADSVELTMRGHSYDALVGVAGCDKSLPGMMMAMCRLNVPSIFIYGGSILPGTFKGKPVTGQDVFEAVGKHSVGEMSDADLDDARAERLPVGRRLRRQFTANTMATVSEAIGLALPYSAGAPAPYEIRDKFCMPRARDHGADRQEHPAARHRHPQGAGKRRGGGRRDRRLDQCRAASAGDRPRMRHQVRPVRRRRNLQKDTLISRI